MAPARKRKLRFVTALTCALLLACALVYTSFSASSEARSPSQLAASAKPGQVYELTGKVEPGSIHSRGTTHSATGARSSSTSASAATRSSASATRW